MEDDTDPGEQRYTNLKVSPLRAFDHYLNYPIEGSISEAEAIRDAIDSPTEQAILDATRQSLDEQGQVDFDNRIDYDGWSEEDPKKPPYSDKVYRRQQISPEGTSIIMPHEFQVAHHDKNLPPIIPYESKAEGYWPGGIHPYDDPSTWYDDEDDGINPLERLQRISDMGIQGAKDFEQKNASEPMDLAMRLLKRQTTLYNFANNWTHPDYGDVTEYHGTNKRNIPSIMQYGLDYNPDTHNVDGEYDNNLEEPYVWTTNSKEAARGYPYASLKDKKIVGIRAKGLPTPDIHNINPPSSPDIGAEYFGRVGEEGDSIDPARLVFTGEPMDLSWRLLKMPIVPS